MAGETEWDDALIRHGIKAAPPKLPDEDDMALERIEREQAKDPLENKTLTQLDELEDEVDEDILESYRTKRLAEIRDQQARNKFGHVSQIRKVDWETEVTKADADIYVVVHLLVEGKQECRLLNQCFDKLANKFKYVKFLKIVGKEAIENYPDRACPTILIYHKGDIVKQIVGLDSLGLMKCNSAVLEWVLAQDNVLKTELDDDPRKELVRMNMNRGALPSSKKGDNDDDDDDDASDDD